jgi:uncharacterized RDD family membrane protein YckC
MDQFQSFSRGMEMTFGNSNISSQNEMNQLYFSLFFNNILFIEILIVLSVMFAIGPIYYIVTTNFTSIGTTFGRKIFNIYPINQNNEKPSFVRIFLHYLLSLIPIIAIFYIAASEALNQQYGIEPKYSKFGLAVIVVFIISWYDLIFVTVKKLMAHDFFAGISFFIKGGVKEEQKSKISFPFYNAILKQVKGIRGDIEKSISKIKKVKKEAEEKTKEMKKAKTEKKKVSVSSAHKKSEPTSSSKKGKNTTKKK